MYTLRIIDQTHNGAEEKRNVSLGTAYDILMKAPRKLESSIFSKQEDRFIKAINEWYSISPLSQEEKVDDTIVGFIYGKEGGVYPIRNFNCAYIVGENGQTIERIYGVYEKY